MEAYVFNTFQCMTAVINGLTVQLEYLNCSVWIQITNSCTPGNYRASNHFCIIIIVFWIIAILNIVGFNVIKL